MWKNDPKELLNSTDIQDPTDFPPSSTTPGLRALDNALRCKICQELYEAPVVLTCGHCFCSLCARNQLSEKPACPTCWKEAAISSFRVNPAMEEAVTAWKDARPFVLRVIDEAIDLRTTASESSRPAKRHKPDTPVLSNSVSPRKQSRGHDNPGPSRGRDGPDGNTPNDDVEQDTCSNTNNSKSSVECPVCGKSVPMTKINAHLDTNCKHYSILSGGKNASSSKSGQKDAWSKLLDGKRSGKDKERPEAEVEAMSPLPKASYTVLKDKQIRDLLAAQDLSTAGDRSQLISRHERWVALYNANLDRSPALRKRLAELRLEMRRWEEDRRASRKDPLKIDITEYRRANKAEFERLVQRARGKPGQESPRAPDSSASLSDRAASCDLRGPVGASGSETDTILVTSDVEG
ncbi:hypothetical protein EDB92DRAFT_2079603 [Lactarius akahatsu]|uniref:Postreplication repair E3 ubiquitin-protein ligase RAD18 n=1 Tax=Lactarius akahatsu TaxID=416441 RepID=A0AAD4QI81_9AGAM|nr:hypothetical protein EDB92DRAFT_2079603 [Lactarius akahatsu]